ncbi:CpsD/CapB family tyrosine-protein kinase [Tepidibacter formicigenes]|jgi:capsular exopolysaccharide synthesis family protein|uniref:non-specific protein-tyrosine kinase n=1 Tax=Tepidibacter formicigenes DSM 15518 TaxID=1123349 RepID=A0A1M6TIV6_9FIRM|nr:CpsD/CapB family tyrosine-protein kinase [Tepidibacter formicigenes]SHK56867.1 capsular exopolysaccharide family [Tepidibacter formicigenes DSM 15518]
MRNDSRKLIVRDNPKSPISEAYRNIRTNIQFANIDKNLKTIMLTSATQGEGKTTTISNIAVTLADLGKKVIVIDCDLRKPKVHKIFKISNTNGITDILLENTSYKEYVNKDIIENLHVLTAGQTPPNPAEMLSSNKMKDLIETIKKDYDYVLIDTPPVAVVTDAAIISTFTDGVVLVCASGQVEIDLVKRSKENLKKVNANILGVILNKLPLDISKSYYYYSNYYGGETNNSKKRKGILSKVVG